MKSHEWSVKIMTWFHAAFFTSTSNIFYHIPNCKRRMKSIHLKRPFEQNERNRFEIVDSTSICRALSAFTLSGIFNTNHLFLVRVWVAKVFFHDNAGGKQSLFSCYTVNEFKALHNILRSLQLTVLPYILICTSGSCHTDTLYHVWYR